MRSESTAPKAFSYLRFSTLEQQKGDSFRRQTALAQDYVRRQGLTLDTGLTFHDLGTSAYRGKNSETGRLGDFLEAVRTGLVPRGSYLLVESLDRISRQAARKALRVLEQICEEGITVVTLADNRAYTQESLDSDPMSLIMSLLVFIRANEESATKSRRLRASWHSKRLKASEGIPQSARCPGWIRLDPTANRYDLIPERAAIVRRIYEEAARGVGYHTLAQALNREGVPVFGRGSQWYPSYIVKMLRSPAVVGTLEQKTIDYEGTRRVRSKVAGASVANYYPAAVAEDLYLRVQAMNRSRAPLHGNNAKAPVQNIFGGIARCAVCGGSATVTFKGARDRHRRIVCTKAKNAAGCEYRTVPYTSAEAAFLREAPRLLAKFPVGKEGRTLEREIDRIEANLEGLDDALQTLLENAQTQRSAAVMAHIVEVERERDEIRSERDRLLARLDEVSSPLVKRRVEDLRVALCGPKGREALPPEKLDRTVANALIRQVFSEARFEFAAGVFSLLWKHGPESEIRFAWPAKNDAT